MITDYERTVVEPLERCGIPYSIEMGGKHKVVVWGDRRYSFASTPSDDRGALNARADITRILRKDGVIKGRPLEPVVLMGDEAEADTRDVAEWFEKDHHNVLKSVRSIAEKAAGNSRVKINSIISNDLTGSFVSHYLLNRTAFTLLVMGFTGQKAFDWKLSYIDAFDRMEDYIRGSIAAEHRALVDQNRENVLRLTAVEAELSSVRADLEASIALQLEQKPIIIIRKAPFVRPSLRRKSRNA